MSMKIIKTDEARLSYIKFILIGDSFELSKQLRTRATDLGMDGVYDICDEIATAFIIYDECEEKTNYMSEYESLEHFLDDYYNELSQLISEEDIDLIKIIRSRYE